ncbi:glutamate/tyrosine decarboxylase-like PLP-dependent enzyme [Saccharopolyspora erythraea NRRL 2338]|uniref:Amino acid decarboxylase,pyridoxal-dependent protein n=2 Tax=Saccharopolyspora erythraea TaxID=1836 RepID=A4FGC4_SACEN|nr:pyridoxal-dependent decarboxylase [Saccharopolyspora erythraea]EQD84898.1 amino acid decarboxylase [Saccharopolyspora erythraea D]PFG96803.1 glutamate/tyrosine decarboxylase-like PLP-dependent enzyme [Saccharopolyspora erythraea NRRL 2338]QRK87044.1 aspartate aminotransferase family protein [Saccharopolyspora erythraea]CAM03099.1 putative amino acid decarboxylase,pyridoxal-dependent protein [Saccharopolyspora erythraea NRRL 2338]
MDPILAADLERFPELLADARDRAVRALAGLATRPVGVPPTMPEPAALPVEGVGAEGAAARFHQRWEPGFSGSAGPRYLGFVTGGTTPAALVGDWLTGTYDQNAVSAQDSSAAELERETVRWLGELFGLGGHHRGAFVSGATMSNFTGLAIAREWAGERIGVSPAESGAGALGDVPVLSGSPHSTIYKALSMLGLGRGAVRLVPTLPDREAVDVDRLEAALAGLDGRPAIVVANAGTVNSVDFDDLRAIAELRERFPFWLHVDGAFGAFAALSPAHAHLVEGIDQADSVCVDLHKWLNVPYDSAVQFSTRPDLQVRIFQNSAAYLGLPGENPDFVHLTPESSRRLRALPAWFALTAYGSAGHREIVERTVHLARFLGERVAELPGLRMLAPVRFNVVCFTLEDDPTEAAVAALAHALAETGELFLTPTVYKGVPALRAAFSNWRTTEQDVERVVEAIARVRA